MLLSRLWWQQLAHSGTLARICACRCARDYAALQLAQTTACARQYNGAAADDACRVLSAEHAAASTSIQQQQQQHRTRAGQNLHSQHSDTSAVSSSSGSSRHYSSLAPPPSHGPTNPAVCDGHAGFGELNANLGSSSDCDKSGNPCLANPSESTSSNQDASSSSSRSSNADSSNTSSGGSGSGVDVLKEPLVKNAAMVKTRAHHVGARIHIGRLVTQCKEEDMRVLSGKDYAMVWLKDASQQPAPSTKRPQPSLLGWPGKAAAFIDGKQESVAAVAVNHDVSSLDAKDDMALGDQSASGYPEVTSPYIMVAYRYGSVVFFGGSAQQDAVQLSKLQQQAQMLYAAGRDVDIKDLPNVREDLPLYINPSSPCWVAKRQDAVVLKRLDVGNARVISSILGKSVALGFYKNSVDASLQRFNEWKQLAKPRNITVFSSSHDKTLFRVMAASNLVIVEARGLLDMVSDAAWKYEIYDEVWQLLSQEYELKERFSALELKLRQIEEEASFDIGIRHGRRYGKLERMVIWLLMWSVAMSLVELVLELTLKAVGGKSAQAADRKVPVHGDDMTELDGAAGTSATTNVALDFQ